MAITINGSGTISGISAGVFPEDMAATIQAVKDKYPKGDA